MIAIVLSLMLAQAPSASGRIIGRVFDKDTGRPIARAVVYLLERDERNTEQMWAVTTDEGIFQLSGLAPGHYSGHAEAARYQFASVAGPDQPELVVRAGETTEIAVPMSRSYAIGLRLIDVSGNPLSEVGVSVQSIDNGNMVVLPFARASDDQGHLRVFDVPPGRYRVCAEPNAAAASDTRRLGDRLVRTCYPSTTDEGQADPVTVAHGDLDGIEIRVLRGRTFTLSGTIVDAGGARAEGAHAFLNQYVRNGSSGMAMRVDGFGQFRATNLQPGTYALQAIRGGPNQPEDRRPAEAVFLEIHVVDADIENLVVPMRRTVDVAVRVTTDDLSRPVPKALGSGLLIESRLADDRTPGAGSTVWSTRAPDGTLVLPGMFGSRRLDVQVVPAGWYVKAIRYGSLDVTDAVVELKDNQQSVDVVLSDRGATVAGMVADVVEKRVARAQVLLFRMPADKDDVTRLAGNVLSMTGHYTVGPVRPGEYAVLAVPADTTIPGPTESDRVAALAALGERITLADTDQRTVDVRVVTPR